MSGTSDDEMSTPTNSSASTPSAASVRASKRRRQGGNADLDSPSNRDLLLQLRDDMCEIKTTIKNFTLQVQELDNRLVKLEQVRKAQDHTISEQNNKIQALERIVEDLYCNTNENNIVINGIRFNNIHDARTEINGLFRHLEASRPPSISNIRRLGETKKLIIKFANYGDKSFLYKNAAYLRTQGVVFEDDLPPTLQKDKEILLRRRRELLENGAAQTVKVLRRALLVDGRDLYHYDRATDTMGKRDPKTRPPLPSRRNPSSQQN